MADYVTLMGAEQVASAGRQIASAADTMRQAGGNIDDALERHRRFLDDWLVRFADVVDKLAAGPRVVTIDGQELLYMPPGGTSQIKG